MAFFPGANNKYHFARPASAQHAADILGTTTEELSRAIFNQGQSSQSLSPAYRLSTLFPHTNIVYVITGNIVSFLGELITVMLDS